jgi:cell division protease FtsH
MGVTMFLPERDQFSSSREKLESEISSLYGGRLAEEIVFGPQKVTTGAQNDIERATLLATNMVIRWGFSERVGALAYAEASSVGLPGSSISKIKPLSEGTAQLIDEEIRALLGRNYERAERLIRENLDKLHLMAEALMTQETLDRSQIHQIMEGRTAFPLAG